MDVATFWLTLLRRWYLVLAAVILTTIATWMTVRAVGPTYTAEGTAVLFPPATTIIDGTTVETSGNPYLMLGGLSQARDIVIRRLSSKEASEKWAKAHPGAEYEAGPDFTTSGPIILVTVEADDKGQAVAGLDAVLGSVPDQLKDLQADLELEAQQQITSKLITMDTKPDVERKGQIRGGIVAGAPTLALCLLLIGLFDGLRGRRSPRASSPKRQRGGRRAQQTESSPGPPPVAPEPVPAGRRRADGPVPLTEPVAKEPRRRRQPDLAGSGRS